MNIAKTSITSITSVLSLLVLAACGEDGGGSRGGGETIVVNAGECAPDNLTATCTCASQGNITGQQTCIAKTWSACQCTPRSMSNAGTTAVVPDAGTAGSGGGGGQGVINDPPGNDSAHRFHWKQTPFELGSCKAGHYVGTFMGFYASPAAFTAPVPVVSAPGADGAPGLEFTLTKVPGAGEIFSIDGGKMRGTANGFFPFTADLRGTLDCSTKKYVGTIENGEYDVFGTKYQFIGTMTADYDKIQNKFIAGKWTCTEPSAPPPFDATAGGSGDWESTWTDM
jgi:hypothetical protein